MVRKIQAKTILRLNAQGLSGRAISRSQGMSRRSVSDVLDAAKAAGVGWDDIAGKTDDEVYALLFPGRGEHESVYEQPDWGKVHRELTRVGVTLRILHGEYVDECQRAGMPPYGLRQVLQAVRRVRAETRRDLARGTQGRPHHRGRLGGQDHARRGSGHR